MRLPQFVSRATVGFNVRTLPAICLCACALVSLPGCYGGGSARADYYTSRAIEAQARDGDGSIVIVGDRADELRQAILRAKRVQLAGVDEEK